MKVLTVHLLFRQKYRCLPSVLLPYLITLQPLHFGQVTGSTLVALWFSEIFNNIAFADKLLNLTAKHMPVIKNAKYILELSWKMIFFN